MMNHAVKGINFNTFIDNIRDNEGESVNCPICRAMGHNCHDLENCPNVSQLAEFLTGEMIEKKPIKLTQLEYDVLRALESDYGDEPVESCPVICDLIEYHFDKIPNTSMTVSEILERAKVED